LNHRNQCFWKSVDEETNQREQLRSIYQNKYRKRKALPRQLRLQKTPSRVRLQIVEKRDPISSASASRDRERSQDRSDAPNCTSTSDAVGPTASKWPWTVGERKPIYSSLILSASSSTDTSPTNQTSKKITSIERANSSSRPERITTPYKYNKPEIIPYRRPARSFNRKAMSEKSRISVGDSVSGKNSAKSESDMRTMMSLNSLASSSDFGSIILKRKLNYKVDLRLTKFLRHEIKKKNIPHLADGSVCLDHILNFEAFENQTKDSLLKIANNDKRRYQIRVENGLSYIRATYKHSYKKKEASKRS